MSNERKNLFLHIYLHIVGINIRKSPSVIAGVIRDDRQTNCVFLSD